MLSPLAVTEQYVRTNDGWSLHLRRTVSDRHFDKAKRPLLIVPGYGMNNFIFGYHPRGTSLERWLAEAGYEVWSFNMRAQGDSHAVTSKPGPVTLHAYATKDLPRLIAHVLEHTRTHADTLNLVGASLGGTVSYSYLSLHENTPVASLVTMGSPLRWDDVHPLVKVAFASPALAGAVKVKGARAMLKRTMPALMQVPALLEFYMNTKTIDMEHIGELVRTVEDPLPSINRDIAHWVKTRDLILGDVNVTRAIGELDLPLLVVLSNRDGIVPEATAMSAASAWGGDVEVLRVGDDKNWYAHANLFVANDAPTEVFDPMIAWLDKRESE